MKKIICLICLICLIGIKREVRAAVSSKLGLFLIYSSQGGEKLINACPKMMTFFDPRGDSNRLIRLRDYKTKCGGGISVVRIHIGSEGIKYKLTDDPIISAENYYQKVIAPAIAQLSSERNNIDYLSGTNEFENLPEELVYGDPKNWQWLGKFWLKLSQNIKNAGFKPNIGDINVGHPHDLSVIGFLVPYLREIKKLGGVWSYHGYTVDYSMNNAELENSLRYRKFYEVLRRDPDLASMPILITETGVAESGNKFRGYMPDNIEKFKTWLEWYDGELQKDGYVIGATIFQSGETSQWASFNTDYIAEWLCLKLGGTDCNVSVEPYKGTATVATDKCAGKKSKVADLTEYLSSLFVKNTEDLKPIIQGGLPPVNLTDAEVTTDEGCPDEDASTVQNAADRYNTVASMCQPPMETSKLNWAERAWEKFMDVFDFGNKKAEEYASCALPKDVASNALVEQYNNELIGQAGEEQNVLGIFGSKNRAMELSLSLRQCGALPPELCKNNIPGGESSAPSRSPNVSIAPPPPGGGGYGSVGKCELGYGYCSVEYLKPFFDNDQIKAEKASQICQRESGSDFLAVNDHCLASYPPEARTLDYSVGLFQYNLAASNDRCPGGVTRDPWDTEGYCRVVNESELAICRDRFYDPVENIKKAVELSGNGTYWGHWSAAGPDYCDIL